MLMEALEQATHLLLRGDGIWPKVIIAKYQFIRKWSEIKEFIGDVGL